MAKGLDIVALKRDRSFLRVESGVAVADLGSLLMELRPRAVGVDASSSWARAGNCREAERALQRLGISVFATPSDVERRAKPFYAWMHVGMATYEQAYAAGYELYRAGPCMDGHVLEVFPHASAVALRKRLPPKGELRSAPRKRAWRMRALTSAGVSTKELRSIDAIDAALVAVTVHMALEQQFTTVGDPAEGVIVLPSFSLTS